MRACVRVIGVRLGVCLCTARLKKDTRNIKDSSGSKTKLLSDDTRHICDSGLCHNHGSCINVTGVAECKCQESYAGQYCDGRCFKGPPSIRRQYSKTPGYSHFLMLRAQNYFDYSNKQFAFRLFLRGCLSFIVLITVSSSLRVLNNRYFSQFLPGI